MTLVRAHREVLLILREFAATHGAGGEFDNLFDGVRPEDIESLLDRIQKARKIPPGHTVEELKDIRLLIAGVNFRRYLEGIEDALKLSAEADLVRAIVDGYTFLDERPGHHRSNAIIRYLDRMRELAFSLYSESERSEAEQDEETEEDHEAL